MDIQRMLADLQNERERIDQAISALQALNTTGAGSGAGRGAAGRTGARRGRPPGRPAGSGAQAQAGGRRRRRTMSPAARKRISEMMKQRWAERKKKAGK
jgi:hypothetical protein